MSSGVKENAGNITQTDYGYTGQRNLDSGIGLMDYKARFYSPYINRFIQPDTLIPDPYNPQAYNRFSYVYNNPIIYIDPTGHKGTICMEGTSSCYDSTTGQVYGSISGSGCTTCWSSSSGGGGTNQQTDITDWLVEELNIQLKNGNLSNPGVCGFGMSIEGCAGFRLGSLYGSHYNLFGNAGIYNIKEPILVKIGNAVVLCGLDGCRWVDYSAPGNIMFGYLSAARGIPQGVAWVAGGALEFKDSATKRMPYSGELFSYGDNPGDKAAVDFGYSLFKDFPNGLTGLDFKLALTTDVLNSFQPAPPTSGHLRPPAWPQINTYPPGFFLQK